MSTKSQSKNRLPLATPAQAADSSKVSGRAPTLAEPSTPSSFAKFVSGKTVIVVCPSKAIENKGLGDMIDTHDIVVRLNMGYDFPVERSGDFGSRSDLCYHYLSLPNEFRRDYDLAEMKRCGIRFIVIPPRPEKEHFAVFRRRNEATQLPFVLFDQETMNIVRCHVPGLPFIGVLAVAHLLRQPVNSVHILGMNFFETGHFTGYDRRTEVAQIAYAHESQYDSRGEEKRHYIPPQREFVRSLLRCESRLTCDNELAASLGVDSRSPNALNYHNEEGER